MQTERIDPSDIRLGDHLNQHGCIFEVKQINVYCYSEDDYFAELAAENDANVHDRISARDANRKKVYVCRGSYVSGDEEMFHWFRGTVKNGTERDPYTSQQGNKLAQWYRVIK